MNGTAASRETADGPFIPFDTQASWASTIRTVTRAVADGYGLRAAGKVRFQEFSTGGGYVEVKVPDHLKDHVADVEALLARAARSRADADALAGPMQDAARLLQRCEEYIAGRGYATGAR